MFPQTTSIFVGFEREVGTLSKLLHVPNYLYSLKTLFTACRMTWIPFKWCRTVGLLHIRVIFAAKRDSANWQNKPPVGSWTPSHSVQMIGADVSLFELFKTDQVLHNNGDYQERLGLTVLSTSSPHKISGSKHWVKCIVARFDKLTDTCKGHVSNI